MSEATGNEGGSYERAYHRAAIVLWHATRYADVLLQGGATAALPYLKKLVEDWSAADKPSRSSAAWRDIATLTVKVIDTWAVGEDRYWERPKADGEHRCEMLRVLNAMGDARLLRQFIEKIVMREFDGAEQDQLVAGTSVLGAKAAGGLLAELVAKRMKTRHKACTELLRRFTKSGDRGAKSSSSMNEAYRKVAEAAVEALPTLDSSSDSRRWREDGPLEAATIASLLQTLRDLNAARLMSAACDSIIAAPETFVPDALLVPALETLHRAGATSLSSDRNLGRLWEHAATFLHLLARSGAPPREPTDWEQRTGIECSCEDCRELKKFASNPSEKTHRFRMAKDRRRHLHDMIDRHDLDMTHETERRGSPYTLVCTKTTRHHERRVAQYENDVRCLKTLIDLVGKRSGKLGALLTRVRGASGPSAS